MIKMKIVLDEDKIDESTLEDMYDKLKKIFKERGINETKTIGIFSGTNNKDDFANFGLVIWKLKEQDWFIKNVLEWKWDVDGEIEDLVEHYRLKEVTQV